MNIPKLDLGGWMDGAPLHFQVKSLQLVLCLLCNLQTQGIYVNPYAARKLSFSFQGNGIG
jgi:hypothetical protein